MVMVSKLSCFVYKILFKILGFQRCFLCAGLCEVVSFFIYLRSLFRKFVVISFCRFRLSLVLFLDQIEHLCIYAAYRSEQQCFVSRGGSYIQFNLS